MPSRGAKGVQVTLDQLARRTARRNAVTGFVAMSLVLLAAGYAYYQCEVGRVKRENYSMLASIGELKAEQIQQWRDESTSDARWLARSLFHRPAITEFLTHPTNAGPRAALLAEMQIERAESKYHDVILLPPGGERGLTTQTTPTELHPATRRAFTAALGSQEAVISDFFREPDGGIHIDTVAAVRDAGGIPLAVVILRSSAHADLYPLIQSWPTRSRSAEALLVQRDGEEVVFLNELRHRTNTALQLRFPLTRTDIPAVQAVLGVQGWFKGRDYRGVEALSDLRPIPDSPWFLVAKMDAAEILAEVRYRTATIAGIVGLLILLTAAMAALFYRRWLARGFRDLYESERQRREAEEFFRTTLYSIGDAVITTDPGGRVREMNPVAERLTGWSEAEARGKPADEIFRVINEATRQPVASLVNTALQRGLVVELGNHTLLIARDGTEYPIAESAEPIRSGRGVIVGVVLVFSDQTVPHAARQALRASEEKLRMIVEHSTQLFYSHNLNNELTYVSPQARQMFDCEPAEAMHRWTEFLTDHPINARGVENTRAAIETGQPQPAYELQLKTKLGRLVWVEVHESPVVVNGQTVAIVGALTDITARKRAEAERQKFAMLADSSSEFIGMCDLDMKPLYVNAAGLRIVGLPDMAAACQVAVQDYFFPEDQRFIAEEFFPRVLREGHGDVEIRLRHFQTGEPIWMFYYLFSVRDASGEIVGWATVSHDITERRQAEEQLRASEREFRALAEAMPQIVWATRPDGWNIYFNQRWMDYTGLTLEESNGHGWNKPFHPDDQQRAWEAWQQATATVTNYSLECRLRRADGAYRWWLIRGVPWCGADGKVLKWFGTCTDIHDLKQTAESLRLLGSAVEQARESILITDAQIDLPWPRIVFANPAFTQMTGYTAAEVVGQTPRILHGPRTDRAVLDRLRQSLERGEPFAGEAINYRKDGSEFVLELQIAPLRNEHGTITHFVSIQRDITERKLAEERLQASVLEQQALLKEVHHRVKNNLQVITSLLRLEAGRIDHPMTRSVLGDMQHRIRTMALLHESLYRTGNFAAVDMAAYLNQLTAYLLRAHAAPAATDQLRLELAAAPPDSIRLESEVASVKVGIDQAIPCGLLVNELVTNALKHAFPGGRTGVIRIELQPVADSPQLRLRVADDGVGLPGDIEERRKSSLGLQLVSDLVRQLGGSLVIAASAGTTFEVTFVPQTNRGDTEIRRKQL